jgi:hypothetical protein
VRALPGGCGATNDPSAQAFFNAIRTHFADPINGGNARSRATPIRSLSPFCSRFVIISLVTICKNLAFRRSGFSKLNAGVSQGGADRGDVADDHRGRGGRPRRHITT